MLLGQARSQTPRAWGAGPAHHEDLPRQLPYDGDDARHGGVYTNGGSWFQNDACVYLDGLIHGVDPAWTDEKPLWRLERELATMPAFHESISTVDGHPHGHHLYSWNSGFWWLRREVRERLEMNGPDPLAVALDKKLGVLKERGLLVLRPETLRP